MTGARPGTRPEYGPRPGRRSAEPTEPTEPDEPDEPTTRIELTVLPAGDRALLLAPDRPDHLPDLVALLQTAELPSVQDIQPAAETVLVTLTGADDVASVEAQLRRLIRDRPPAGKASSGDAPEVTIPVRYDGSDLDDVARLLDMSTAEVVAAHTHRTWRCRFIGFAAGFGYLEPDEPWSAIPRRPESRTSVPAGSVALADHYSAVYPRNSPGGWQLIGTTDARMWDLTRPQPALLRPGTRVRFVEETRP